MPRYKLTIEYDGGRFVGWQMQKDLPSVQQALETAVLRFCGESVRFNAAGRTDSGVHALGMVTHMDLEQARPLATRASPSSPSKKRPPISMPVFPASAAIISIAS